ncbi:MAG: outer membrane beta-barrel protein [Aquaticitalea sp.]
MKRPQIVSVTFILCFLSLSAFSQNIGFGILGGPNYYTLRVDSSDGETTFDGSSAKKNIQYHVGAFLDVNFSSALGLNGNIVYQRRGLSLDPDTKLEYIDINPLLKFDVNNSYGNGFYLKGGFRYSFLLSAQTFDEDVDVKEAFNNSNIGVVGGFGVDVSDFLGLELLVDYSPMNIFEDVDGASITSRLIGGNFRLVFYIEKVLNNR